LYASHDVTRVIKSKTMRLAGHVARVGDMRNAYKILSENLKVKDRLEDLGVEKRTILKFILGK